MPPIVLPALVQQTLFAHPVTLTFSAVVLLAAAWLVDSIFLVRGGVGF